MLGSCSEEIQLIRRFLTAFKVYTVLFIKIVSGTNFIVDAQETPTNERFKPVSRNLAQLDRNSELPII